jgi:nucleoside-diphosphate-sugar epimerase
VSDLHVVFGTGALGAAVGEALVERGVPVRLVNRSGANPVGDGTEVMAGEAADAEFAAAAAQGAATVYQCLNPTYSRWVDEFPPLQRSVMEAAVAADAKYVSLENVYMYGDTKGVPITEDLPYRADTRKGRVRAAMATELHLAHEAGRLRVAIGRASDYFGPRAQEQSYFGSRVIPAALAGRRAMVFGDLDQPHSWAYSADIGRALAVLGTDDEADGQVWHLPTEEPKTVREMLHLIYAEAGAEPRMTTAPKLLLRAMGLFDANVRELIEMWYEFDQPFIVDSTKFSRKFGLVATPLADAVSQTVDWYRREG